METADIELFPCPMRIQILRAYPTRFVEADGYARCELLLDAFEIFSQQPSDPNVSSATYLDYKGHSTVKFLGAVDPIGCLHAASVSDGNGGKKSD